MSQSPQPKTLALMFLLGAFLTGGAVTYAAERVMTTKAPVAHRMTEQERRAELAKELNLTESQRLAVDSILNWRKSLDSTTWHAMRPQFDATRDSARVLIMQRLEPAQQTAFRALIAKLNEKNRNQQKP